MLDYLPESVLDGLRASHRLGKRSAKGGCRVYDSVTRQAVKNDIFYFAFHRPMINHVSRALVPQYPSLVTETDWKYLVVLDACRHDAYAEHCSIDGNLRRANSCAGWTKEWAMQNFSEGDWSDTIYVSASSWPGAAETWLGENPFHSVEEVWSYGADEKTGAVYPETVRAVATKAVANHPEKRMIVHFQQPHNPLVGEKTILRDEFEGDGTVYQALRRGQVSKAEVWEAYVSNLQMALEEVEKLLAVLDGTVAITADHGECFGEFNLFEHPGALVPPIIQVPWHVVKKTRDRDPSELDVETELSPPDAGDNEYSREEHLKQLGYL